MMKHILILCNGDPPSKQLFLSAFSACDYFIAADGGGNIARDFGQTPDVVIGDLDSFESRSDDTFEVVFDPDQYSNDLEKALQLALKKQGTHVQVLGATGKRLDHTLKNLSVLKQFDNQFEEIVFKDNFGDTFLIPRRFAIDLPPGTPVSLFPLSGRVNGITTSGLKYPLKNEPLENGVHDGSSNEVIESPVEITHQTDDLLIFIAKKITQSR
ncbi:MAG TPA: thiamine diphosphokinase [Balneolaceae bacterium]|nr:thiamine diphosphokinase [Balneolaceae bacterium]